MHRTLPDGSRDAVWQTAHLPSNCTGRQHSSATSSLNKQPSLVILWCIKTSIFCFNIDVSYHQTNYLNFLMFGASHINLKRTKNVYFRCWHTHCGLTGLCPRLPGVSRYQTGKTDLDFTEVRDSEWQWHQLGHMQVCISLQTDNHARTPPLSFLQARYPSCCDFIFLVCWRTLLQDTASVCSELKHIHISVQYFRCWQ